MSYIEGIDRDQLSLYPTRLDDVIPQNDPVRLVAEFCSGLPMEKLGFVRAQPAITGRPGYEPSSMLALLIWGMMNGICSSRRLERATQRHVDAMWLLRGLQPDFKTISEFRRKHVRQIVGVGRECVAYLRSLGLVSGRLAAVDGTKLRASNAKDRNFTEKTLAMKRDLVEERIKQCLEEMEAADVEEAQQEQPATLTTEQMKQAIARLRQQKDRYDALAERMKADNVTQISLTDPQSRMMKSGDGMNVCYNAQIVVDEQHNLIIASAVTNQVNDECQLHTMAKAAKQALEADTLGIVADAGYVNPDQIEACESEGITPYLPALRTQQGKAGYSKDVFRYDESTNSYTCPAGATLKQSSKGKRKNGREVHYYTTPACKGCALRDECTTSRYGRRIVRRPNESCRERAALRARENPELMKKRKAMVEHPFGTIKRVINHGYLLLRGVEKVTAEFALAVVAYNLKRVYTIQTTS